MCENKNFYGVAMPSKEIEIVQFNLNWKFHKTPSIAYVDLESLIKRKDYVQIILKIIYNKSRWTYFLWVLDVYDMDVYGVENKHEVYKREDFMWKSFENPYS